ncbi:hypothetical protein [Adhaeretor mobilis]|uniref:Uncharacterized protein n=1 Tax=Adhaeretor mobilis TaxID=1930276 RepID=A0A517MU08_9BACT|nr:hypothetical protein [Adhaeretor mobilis]QDS98364.1 hypothetical protein HG15A2_16380 [Adhaeretor mobilis]
MHFPLAQRIAATRNGLSFFEFTGCLFALTGGVVLGSMYLGIDVQGIATSVLEQSKLIETPAGEVDQSFSGDTASDSATDEKGLVLSGGSDSVEATEGAATPTWQEAINNAVNDHMPPELPIEVQKELTGQYWKVLLNALEQAEVAEAQAANQIANMQLYDLLAQKKQLHVAALESLEPLDTHGVNSRVVSYSARLKQWNLDGVRLYSRAMDLLTDTAQAKLSGPSAQSWQSSATQHRMEGRLLKDRQAALKGYVNHWLETAE